MHNFFIFTQLLYIKNNENSYTFLFLRGHHQEVCTSHALLHLLVNCYNTLVITNVCNEQHKNLKILAKTRYISKLFSLSLEP